MTTKLFVLPALAALMLVSCGPSDAEIQAAKEKATADSLAAAAAMEHTYKIDPDASIINWRGTMLGVKSHHGTVRFVDGKVQAKANTITAAKFIADLNSIAPLDSAYAADDAKEGTRSMLVGHLKSGDFFDVANNPTANLEIVEVNGNTATAMFTLRGITEKETIILNDVVVDNGVLKATGTMTFDRQKYGARWASGSKDFVLNDNVELNVYIVARES
jgi:polyisoprenoid-binding protein YceI